MDGINLADLKANDKLEFPHYENMISFMKKLNYAGFVYRQIEPLVIIIDEVPNDIREH